MRIIPVALIDAHPDNANRMNANERTKLIAHMRETGRYPALIVRPHPGHAGRYQVLDGHHRLDALRELGHREVRCEVWDVDDRQADVLLLTLNRLRGEDDPKRRGALLKRLADDMPVEDLSQLLPDDVARIERLIALTDPPPDPAPAPALDDVPQAVTFFLTGEQHRALDARLKPLGRDRSEALVRLLELDAV